MFSVEAPGSAAYPGLSKAMALDSVAIPGLDMATAQSRCSQWITWGENSLALVCTLAAGPPHNLPTPLTALSAEPVADWRGLTHQCGIWEVGGKALAATEWRPQSSDLQWCMRKCAACGSSTTSRPPGNVQYTLVKREHLLKRKWSVRDMIAPLQTWLLFAVSLLLSALRAFCYE